MIAVLAAMLFIGIVTASMVKNTKSQSTASVGYGTMQIMSSTVRSGMIATETYFAMPENATVLEKISARLNANPSGGDASKIFVFKNDKEKTGIGNSKQFFNSELVEVVPAPVITEPTFFSFKIGSGRRENGRNLKTAMAFYSSTNDVEIVNNSTFGAKNAFSSEGNVNNGDAGVDVRDGPATFMKDVKFQNSAPAVFNKDVYFGGKAEFNTNAMFNDKVYFNNIVTMQNLTNTDIFKSSVGFKENISALQEAGGTVDFKVNGNVWFNGSYTNSSGTPYDINFTATGTDNKFYYTNKIPMKTQAMCVKNECPHPNPPGHVDSLQSKHIKGFVNMNQDSTSGYKGSNMTAEYMLEQLKMGNLDPPGTPGSRMDPELDISFATDKSKGGVEKPYSLQEIMNLGEASNPTVSAEVLNTAYEKAKSAGNLSEDGYMVVKLGANSTDGWYSWPNNPSPTATFDKKIIFVLEGSYQWSGSYFPTTTASSTLIYVQDNAVLSELIIKGEFNGLIYTDKNNHPVGGSNKIKVDPDSGKIVGAIHNHSSDTLQWNTTGSNVPPIIQFDSTALNKLARMSKGGASGQWTTKYVEQDPAKRRIHLKPMGYYFF
jgi:hypothetical protein